MSESIRDRFLKERELSLEELDQARGGEGGYVGLGLCMNPACSHYNNCVDVEKRVSWKGFGEHPGIGSHGMGSLGMDDFGMEDFGREYYACAYCSMEVDPDSIDFYLY